MKFEKHTIYKKYHKNGISHILVLDVQRRGMSFAYLTNEKENAYYSNIDGLNIGDINGCVAINRIIYCDWSKITSKYYEKYRKLSIREMRKITAAIKDLYDGVIVYDKNGHMCYSDELDEQVSENISDDEESHIEQKSNNTDMSITETTVTATIKKSTITEILKDNGINVEVNQDNKSERFIDLMVKADSASSTDKACNTVNRHTVKRGKCKVSRHLFSESEALAITTMSYSEIIQKYGVSRSTASLMKRNAKEYFGFKNKSSKKDIHTGVTELFRQGLSIEQVMEEHPEYDISVVKSCYNTYHITKINKTHNTEDLQKMILENGSIDDMIEIDSLTFMQFCERYGCSTHSAKTIKVAIRNILSKNIYFAVFGSEAYNGLEDRMKSIDKNKVKNRIDAVNYETCTRLKDVYEATYNDHFDIITGSRPIPDCLQGNDRTRFMEIIKQRCNERVRDRSYTIDQLKMIDSKNIEAVADIFVVSYGNASSIIYRKIASTNV